MSTKACGTLFQVCFRFTAFLLKLVLRLVPKYILEHAVFELLVVHLKLNLCLGETAFNIGLILRFLLLITLYLKVTQVVGLLLFSSSVE